MNILLNPISILAFNMPDTISLLIVGCVVILFSFAWVINRIVILRIRKSSEQSKWISTIMQHTLEQSNNYVLMLDVLQRRAINLHGDLMPKEGLGYDESLELIHPEDLHIYTEFIGKLYHGSKTTDECVFRWDMSGKKRLGQWRYMRDIGIAEHVKGNARPHRIFCTLIDKTDQMKQEQEELDLSYKYQRVFEQSIVGLAFYDKNGRLLNVNQKMREILKFQSDHDPYYFDNTLYDMPSFRDILSDRKVEELYFCTKSVIIERGVNCYTEMRVHPIYNANGELFYITFSIRDITQERELYLQNKKNDLELHRANEAIQEYETELQYLMNICDMRFWRASFKDHLITFYQDLTTPEKVMTLEELSEAFVDEQFQDRLRNPEIFFTAQQTHLVQTRAIFYQEERFQWNYMDCVPYYNKDGQLEGNYGVIRNVTTLIEKQEQLRKETERANDSGRLKSTFMANMTHEIRTPLNSIVGFSDVLPMLSSSEEKEEIIRVIMNNCDMLLRLINDILAISSLDSSGIKIIPRTSDFALAFRDICESLKERVQEPGVEFVCDNPYDTFITSLDNGRIQQVITNFVTNAIKYTHQGHIKVGYRYEEEPGSLYIYCEDTGAGIPKEDQAKVFERFVKLNDFVQGTGLGLSICQAIADACNGQIGVDSEGEGKGSTFWMRIPCEKMDGSKPRNK